MSHLQLLFFESENCGACHALEPKIRELCRDFPEWECEFIQAADHPELCGQHLVFSFPAVLLLVDGKEIWRKVGVFALGELSDALTRFGN